MRIPKFFKWGRDENGNTFNLVERNSSANYTNDDNLLLALGSPVLSSLINIRADYLSKVKFYEESGEERLFETEAINLINNPNPYQSKEDFLKQFEWYRVCFGWVYQLPYGASGFNKTAMYNLSPSNIKFKKELERSIIYKSADIKELNKYAFEYTDLDTKINLTYGDIIPFYDVSNGINCSILTSTSRIDAIKKQVENINLATDAQNIIIKTNGREMIYKEKQAGTMGNVMPANPKDKEDAERKFQLNTGLGINRNRTVVLNREMGWKSMHIPYEDLGFNSILESNSNLIAQAMQVPNEIYKAYKDGDTFENQEQAELNFIQSVIQPIANNLSNSYSSSFGKKIKASFEHLPCMQSIEEIKVDRLLKVSTALRNLVQSGLTIEQANDYLVQNGLKILDNE